MKPMMAWNSIRARAIIIGVKTLSADVGFLAIPDRAASAARPWLKVPPKAARPIAKADPTATRPDAMLTSPPSAAKAKELTKSPLRTANALKKPRFIGYPAYNEQLMIV